MYKPTQEEINAMPALGWEDVKHTGHNERGEPCKCSECGKPCRNRLGLRVHINQAHINAGAVRAPRGPYKKRGSAALDTQPNTGSQPSSVTFCPGCGCNIKAVAMAMRLTR